MRCIIFNFFGVSLLVATSSFSLSLTPMEKLAGLTKPVSQLTKKERKAYRKEGLIKISYCRSYCSSEKIAARKNPGKTKKKVNTGGATKRVRMGFTKEESKCYQPCVCKEPIARVMYAKIGAMCRDKGFDVSGTKKTPWWKFW